MVTIIKKGTKKKAINELLVERSIKTKVLDLRKYLGSITLKEDPIELQKQWRNEWQ